jgi:beta-lactamase class A
MNRRSALKAAVLGAVSVGWGARAGAQEASADGLDRALRDFTLLAPGHAAAQVTLRRPQGRTTHGAGPVEQPLFVGSAVKTFILAQYLRDVEAGTLSEDTPMTVGPEVWSPGSPVFIHLQGTTPARSILEAMIAHSDNSATDAALAATGPGAVRRLIAEAQLPHTRIPDSTRKLFSYLAGAPDGVDLGWAGMEKLARGDMPGKPRSPLNDRQTMLSTADELCRWYEQVLAGRYFKQHATLLEFKRISAMADAMPMMAPEDVMAYGKGGSIDWEDFHCFCGAGQMVQAGQQTSFCFIVNWTGKDDTVPKMLDAFKRHSRRCLSLAAARDTAARS